MNDRDFELLSAAFDHEATPEELSRVEQLLATSAEARLYWDELRQLSHSLQDLPREALPVEFPSQVLQLAERRSLLEGSGSSPGQSIPRVSTAAPGASKKGAGFWSLSIIAMLSTAAALFVVVSLWFSPREERRDEMATATREADRDATNDALRGDRDVPPLFFESTKAEDALAVAPEAEVFDPAAMSDLPEIREPLPAVRRSGKAAEKSFAGASAAPAVPGESRVEAGLYEVYVVDVADGVTLEVFGTTLAPVQGLRKAGAADKTGPTTEGLFVMANEQDIHDVMARVRQQIGVELESRLVAMNQLPLPMQEMLQEEAGDQKNAAPKDATVRAKSGGKEEKRDSKPGAPLPVAKPQGLAEKSKTPTAAQKPQVEGQKLADRDDSVRLGDGKKAPSAPSKNRRAEVVPLALSLQDVANLEKDQPSRLAGKTDSRPARGVEMLKETANKPVEPNSAKRILIVVRRVMNKAAPQPVKVKGGA